MRDNPTNDNTLEADVDEVTTFTIGIAWRRLPTRTFPEMLQPPEDDYPDPTSMSLLTIVLCLREAADRGWHEETYYSWRWEVNYTLDSFCQQHSLEWGNFLFMIAPTWETTVLAAEVGLTAEQAARYDAVMKEVTLVEIVSYLAVAGVTGFKRGPVRFLQFLLGDADDIRQLFTYLVHSRNSLKWIHGMIDVFDPQGKRRMRRTLQERTTAILTWVYSTLVNVSGLIAGPDELNFLSAQLPPGQDKVMGFLFPKQMSKLMMAETEDWVTVLAPALWPIFGYILPLRYPTQPLRLVATGHKYCNLLSYVKQWTQWDLSIRLPAPENWSFPMAYVRWKK